MIKPAFSHNETVRHVPSGLPGVVRGRQFKDGRWFYKIAGEWRDERELEYAPQSVDVEYTQQSLEVLVWSLGKVVEELKACAPSVTIRSEDPLIPKSVSLTGRIHICGNQLIEIAQSLRNRPASRSV